MGVLHKAVPHHQEPSPHSTPSRVKLSTVHLSLDAKYSRMSPEPSPGVKVRFARLYCYEGIDDNLVDFGNRYKCMARQTVPKVAGLARRHVDW